MSAVKATNKGSFDGCSQPGDFYMTKPEAEHPYIRLSFICPCGCGTLCGVRVRPDGEQTAEAWGWNRDPLVPTTTPSINILGGPGGASHWHGYLTDGVFTPC